MKVAVLLSGGVDRSVALHLAKQAGQPELTAFYGVEFELENLLQGSAPNPGDADRVRQLIMAELKENKMDIQVRRDGSQILFAYPIAVLVAEKLN